MPLKADPTTSQVQAKSETIAEIRAKLEAADAAVLTEYRGLSVTDLAELRGQLRPTNTEYKVYKNTLVRRAADELGVGEALGDMLAGPVAIAFVEGDVAAAAKALREFAKGNQLLVLKGGLLGDRALAPADVEALADLPSRETLLAQIAGLFEAPLAQTLGVLEALLRDTVGLVQALADKRFAEGEAAPAPEAEATEAPAAEAAAEEAPAEEPAAEAAAEEAPAEETPAASAEAGDGDEA